MPEMKICPNCGKEILAVAKKCKYCGTWIAPKHDFHCPVCCEVIPEDSIICPVCHERLRPDPEPDTTPTQAPDPVHETAEAESVRENTIKKTEEQFWSSSVSIIPPKKRRWIIPTIISALVIGLCAFLLLRPVVESGHSSTVENNVSESFDLAGEAIAGYGDKERATIYEYAYSGRLFNEMESHVILLHYTSFPVDDDGDGWFDVSGDYSYPEWQKNGSFSFEGRSSGGRIILFTENNELFDLMSSDKGFVLKGEWYKYKSNDDRERDRGSWTKHLKVELNVATPSTLNTK